MRKWLIRLLCLAVIVAALFFWLAPGMVENSMNKVVATPLKITPRAESLQEALDVADMHSDTLLWKRDLLSRSGTGMVDLPRLQAGHYALQIFSSVTKTPKGQNYDANGGDTDNITSLVMVNLQPVRTWNSLLERSLFHAEKLKGYADNSDGELRLITSSADLQKLVADRRAGKNVTGAMLSIEGLQDIEGKLPNLDRLYAAGFRMAGVAHFFDNDVAGSVHGVKKGGLTPLGRQVVARMEKLGMIVDVAHASHQAIADILAMATRPVVSSHGGVKGTCNRNRNLTDDEVRGIAKTGGVVGIGFWEEATCSLSPARIADAVVYVRDLVGIDHVGLGSDFDGAVETGFDASQVAAITQALIDRGLSDEDIRKVMGGNVLRVLIAGMVPQPNL